MTRAGDCFLEMSMLSGRWQRKKFRDGDMQKDIEDLERIIAGKTSKQRSVFHRI